MHDGVGGWSQAANREKERERERERERESLGSRKKKKKKTLGVGATTLSQPSPMYVSLITNEPTWLSSVSLPSLSSIINASGAVHLVWSGSGKACGDMVWFMRFADLLAIWRAMLWFAFDFPIGYVYCDTSKVVM